MDREYKILIVGILFTGVLFLIPAYIGYIWAGLFLSLFGGAVYLSVLHRAGMKNFRKKDSGKTTLTLFSLLVVSSASFFGFDYYKSTFQKERLREIRVTIDSSIIETEIRAELIEVYRDYKLDSKQGNIKITDFTDDFFADRLEDNFKFIVKNSGLGEDLNFVFHIDKESDSFSIYSVAEISQSLDKDFENWDGSVGHFQTKTTLTNRGVTHERQN